MKSQFVDVTFAKKGKVLTATHSKSGIAITYWQGTEPSNAAMEVRKRAEGLNGKWDIRDREVDVFQGIARVNGLRMDGGVQ